MTQCFAKIGVSNDEHHVRVIWVEPWPHDFTLLPGESIEIHVHSSTAQAWFHVVETDRNTQIYVELPPSDLITAEVKVFQGTRLLQSGHNRRAAIDAGRPM
ncbi:MAG: hypothetical protein K1X74_10900 [Pirellulales bacterium]|nr:hypothetical protein [Pirellulales bacterium]